VKLYTAYIFTVKFSAERPSEITGEGADPCKTRKKRLFQFQCSLCGVC